MGRGSIVWSKAAAFLLVAAAIFHAVRTATLPITTDEAFTFLRFASHPWLYLLRDYDANHHMLHTVLCKLAVGTLGPAEWTLRLPALLGSWAYLALVWRTARRLAGGGPALLAACVWLSALPQIAEYLSVARGYSLGAAFFLAALHEALQEAPRLARVSLWLGFAATANLVFVIPGIALGLVLMLSHRELRNLVAPAATVLLWVNAVPLHYASPDNFYFGVRTWRETVHSLLPIPALLWCAAGVLALAAWQTRHCARTALVFRVLLLSLTLVGLLFVFRDTPLPYERTGIYLVVLLGLLAGAACRIPRAEPVLALAVLLAVGAAGHVHLRQSGVWPFDAANRVVIEAIQRDAVGRAPRVAASFPLEYGLEFYRQTRRLPWPAVVQWKNQPDAVYLVWRTDESKTPLPAGFAELLRDPVTGVIVGKRMGLPGR
jgi:hypothetical protein